MENNQNSQIRFSGFSEKWKQHKMGDIGSISMCKRIFKSQTTPNGEIPFYKIGTFGRVPDSFISRQLFEEFRYKYSYPEVGDVLISASGTIGRTVVYNGEEAYYQDSNIVWLKRKKELVDNTFLEQFYQIVKWAGTEGSTIKRLYNNNILSTVIFLPPIKEQIKIGDFFKRIDKTISLQQQELDTLKQTKKGFLQKMFPKEGESVPEVRFSEFTEKWEICKLGDIVEITMGQSPDGKNYTNNSNDHILVQGNADIKKGWVSPRVWTTQVTKTASKGDIILGVRAPVGDVGKTQYDVVLGRGVAGIKGNEFIFQLLSEMKTNGFWTRYSTGSTFESINSTDLKEAMINIPSEVEQFQIGNFFKQIDDVIALQEQELDALKQTKKAFLQKMFV